MNRDALPNTTSSGGDFVCPPGVYDCFNNHITDNQIKNALWVAVAAGLACLVLFGLLRNHISTYKLRLKMPNVRVKPPPLPEGGIHQLWSWLYPVFATSDAELVRTAGLDALMLCWLSTLGIQIFLPLSILGMAVLLPINLLGTRHHVWDSTSGAVAFQKLTISSLERGSNMYWFAFFFVYIATGYICWLLTKYYKAYAILRQRYMTDGEALLNHWHDRIAGKTTTGGSRKARAAAQPSSAEAQKKRSVRHSESSKLWSALLELVDVNAQMDNLVHTVGGGTLEMGILSEAPLTASLLSQRHHSMPSPRHGPQPGIEAGQKATSLRAASMEEVSLQSLPRADNSQQLGAQLRKARSEGDSGAAAAAPPAPGSSSGEPAGPRSAYAGFAPQEQGMSREGGETAGGVLPHATSLRGIIRHRLKHLSLLSSPSARISEEGGEEEGHAAGQAPEPISRYEISPPKDAGAAQRILPWWASDCGGSTSAEGAEDGGLEGQLLVGKPSVFFRKTIKTTAGDGSAIAVNAQQYAVLVMDVPDLRARGTAQEGRGMAGWRPLWRGLKRALGTVASSRRRGQDDRSQHGLASKLDSAETPRSQQAPEDAGAKHTCIDVHEPIEDSAAAPPAEFPFEAAAHSAAAGPGTTGAPDVAEEPREQQEESWYEEAVTLTPSQLVEATFQRLFPGSFLYALPVWKHKAVDKLLMEWDSAYGSLHAAEARFEASGCTKRPLRRLKCCDPAGRGCPSLTPCRRVDAIDHWAQRVRALEDAIGAERARCLGAEPSPAYFAFFRTQKDAAFAAQTRLHPEDGHSFRVMEAPGPDEVNWQVLWKSRAERSTREMLVAPLIILIMLVPMGLFTGTLAQATNAICGGPDRVEGKLSFLRTSWYCQEDSLARPLITSLVPSLLLTIWQCLVMPIMLYIFAQMEAQSPSYTALDRRVSSLFFCWGVFNVFLGAMLGGTVVSKIRLVLVAPSRIPEVIGSAFTSSSNFMICFILLQAFAFNPTRLLFPYVGVLYDLAQCFGCFRPRSDRGKVLMSSGMSIAYGREVGVIMLIFIMALAYAASSPLIMPFALCYFITAWVLWRYTCLYMCERCYESGGRLWDQAFNNLCWCLFIMEFFTGCVFLANSAFVQATLLWVTLTPALYRFHRKAKRRWGEAVAHMPLETSHTAPPAYVPPLVYTPPALRPGAAGWWPEYGKAWENWGVPTYTCT